MDNNATKKSCEIIYKPNWSEYIPGLNDSLIEMKMDKIKVINNIHAKKSIVDLNKSIGIVVVKKIEDTDEYELIIGYSTFVKCKLLNLPAKVYITEKTRDEFIKYINNIQYAKVNEINE